MYLIIDHHDSFVYNLKAYFEVLNCAVHVVHCNNVTPQYIEHIENLQGIIFSPGPRHPEDCEHSAFLLRHFCNRIPILGVCLGHQLIGHVFGAKVVKGIRPMHGKITEISNYETGVLHGLPHKFQVTRYHSLIVSENFFPDCLRIDAMADDGAIMAISHRTLPIFGVQFHPEAILSEYGYEVLSNFIEIAKKRRSNNDKVQGVSLL